MKAEAVLLIGGTSAIGRALAREFAAEGSRLYLAARNSGEMQRVAEDLRTRYRASVRCNRFDVTDWSSHAGFVAGAVAEFGGLDVAVITIGHLGDQARAEADFDSARQIIESTYTGVVSILTHLANHLERQQHGVIVVLSSVAGDRGRRSNYVYGSAKAGLDAFLEGLRARLAPAGVRVLTVKPGLVDTRMTFGRPGLVLLASPRRVALAIVRGIRAKRDVIYVPWYWSWIMRGVRAMPEPLFKRLKL